MEYRQLGRTGIQVSAIGLGAEHLLNQPREQAAAMIHAAIERGVNYFDLIWAQPEYRDNMSAAFKGHRDRVRLTAHLGAAHLNGQYEVTRTPRLAETFFHDFLARYQTDHVDVLCLHNIDAQQDYDRVVKPGGLLDLALRLKKEGKTRAVGFSGHTVATARQAVETGQLDMLMFPIHLAGSAVPGKKDLLNLCMARGVGVVAMKPFAGGRLLLKERSIRMARYHTGGAALKLKKPAPITPLQCLAYVLAQPGVSTTVPGCRSLDELAAALAYWGAPEEEKDFAHLVAGLQQYVSGECLYCNHCLPCPSKIDIAQTIRLTEMAQGGLTPELKAAYGALPADASDCAQCGDCVERCPFDVDVIAKMNLANQLFASFTGSPV